MNAKMSKRTAERIANDIWANTIRVQVDRSYPWETFSARGKALWAEARAAGKRTEALVSKLICLHTIGLS